MAGFKNCTEDVQLAEVRAKALVTYCILLIHYSTLQVSLTCGVEQDGEVLRGVFGCLSSLLHSLMAYL